MAIIAGDHRPGADEYLLAGVGRNPIPGRGGRMGLRDERGVYWALGGDDGGWHWYDGQKWVRRDPPG